MPEAAEQVDTEPPIPAQKRPGAAPEGYDVRDVFESRDTSAYKRGRADVEAEKPPAERVAHDFRRVIAAVVVFNDQVAQRTRMGLSEAQVVHLLDLFGSLTPSDLSRHTGLSSGTVTGVLDRLEKTGLVRRERHPDDRRKIVVTLDQERLAEHAAHFTSEADVLSRAIGALDPRELEAVARFLEALLDDPSPAAGD